VLITCFICPTPSPYKPHIFSGTQKRPYSDSSLQNSIVLHCRIQNVPYWKAAKTKVNVEESVQYCTLPFEKHAFRQLGGRLCCHGQMTNDCSIPNLRRAKYSVINNIQYRTAQSTRFRFFFLRSLSGHRREIFMSPSIIVYNKYRDVQYTVQSVLYC